MSVDVEEHFHVAAFDGHIRKADWSQFPSRVVANTERLLALFERRRVSATFFILGWVANWRPIEIFLYDWWPLLQRRRLFQRLAAAQVAIRPN